MAVVSGAGDFLAQYWPGILLLLAVAHFTRNYLTAGASSIPGPFWAKFSNLWRFIDVAHGHAEETLCKLHVEHGDYVRVGPNAVSVRNLDALKTIYGINQGYQKASHLEPQVELSARPDSTECSNRWQTGNQPPTLFTTTDENFHAAIKRPVTSAYSMSTLTEFEPFVDSTIHTFFRRLDEFVTQNKVCDIAKGCDVEGIMGAIEKMLDYAGKVGQMPWLDYVLIKNPLRQYIKGGSTSAVARFARARIDERFRELSEAGQAASPPRTHRDFLARFLEAQKAHPNVVTDNQVFSYTVSNVNAGSDTTAISLRAILYYTLKTPRVSEKLDKELRLALDEGRISFPVSWKQSQEQLPYLDAVIKEALRLHPAVGLLLERIVPEGGLQLPGGPYLPGRTIVGANPWTIHRHSCFGKEVNSFIPERWLRAEGESESAYQSRKQQMLRATFTFGAGPRTCIGKNISLLEIYKLIPSLLLRYKISLDKPDSNWTTVNAWFVRQKNMDVRLTYHN
ncbi:Cytochrome P450 [Penicillium chermesinum]|uniref:Cytochrome P450 n=1 Tax=Penicillium chermesinum TaxID=63820 RepID=A0A9W9P8Y4_9EURO|nr:Cytochrome P450 [Penicillium chermesinum]KAJ5240002.1 Cytochrome P450 [Penicillium chermesinum]